MKLRVLALDYDGTIATHGRLDPGVRAAIGRAREHGLVVVLVTGRILDDLRGLVGDLRLFDAIVAENGALVAFPAAGRSAQLAPAPPAAFVAELRRRRLDVRAGLCVVELSAADGPAVLQVVREQELPLTLHFNRGRLMVLPQAVSKATGLREALRTLRLSPHNALAIGDAENDHELLSVCEVGAAVAWGSKTLQGVADVVVPGDGPAAVADYLGEVMRSERIAAPTPRRRLLLGRDHTGAVVAVTMRGRDVLIAGDPRSGKSWVAGLLCEQLVMQQYCTCILDPEGDYQELELLPGVTVLGGDDHPPSMNELARRLRHADASIVLDLSKLGAVAKHDYVVGALRLLRDLRRRTGLPHRIVVDEAHYFLHDSGEAALLDRDLGGHVLITYRVSGLAADALCGADCVIVTRATDPAEAAALFAACGGAGDAAAWAATLRELDVNEALLLPTGERQGGAPLRFRIAPRLTHHVRHRHKYLDVPVAQDRRFTFRFGAEPGPVVASLHELTGVLAQTAVARLREHVRRGDLSRWIDEVVRDGVLAGDVRDLEERHRLGQLPDFNDAVIRVIHDRYGAPAELL
jgi:hypothetical protein